MTIFKRTIDYEHRALSNHEDLREFSESMRDARYQKDHSQRIFVWSGFGRQISFELFENNSWQQNFVGLFSNQEMWPWKYKLARTESDQLGNQELIEALGSPSEGIIASLRIRDFKSEDCIPSAYYLFEEGDFSANFGLNLKSLVDEIRGIT